MFGKRIYWNIPILTICSHIAVVTNSITNCSIIYSRVVEQGRAEQIFDAPREAYTQALMKAAFELEAVEGDVVAM